MSMSVRDTMYKRDYGVRISSQILRHKLDKGVGTRGQTIPSVDCSTDRAY